MFLSHGSFCPFLQEGNLGAGEKWVITPTTNNGLFTIQCCGDEQGFCLEHSEGHLQFMCNCGTPRQMWWVQKHVIAYIVSCLSGNKMLFLRHGFAKLFLQNGHRGAGELWQFFMREVWQGNVKVRCGAF